MYVPTISSGYGMRKDPISGVYKLHDGYDLLPQTPGAAEHLRPSIDLVSTVWTHFQAGGAGNWVALHYIDGSVQVFYHLRAFTVASGTKVLSNMVVGIMGNTGHSTGEHTHTGFYTAWNDKTKEPIWSSHVEVTFNPRVIPTVSSIIVSPIPQPEDLQARLQASEANNAQLKSAIKEVINILSKYNG